MPAISRAQPGKPARLVYVRSFWRLGTSGVSRRPLPARHRRLPPVHGDFIHQSGVPLPSFRQTAAGSPSPRSLGRRGDLGFRSGRVERRPAHVDGCLDTNCPHWSPDGQLIVFSSNGEGEFDIYVVPAAGGKPRRLTSHPAIDICPTFSRDGKWIYFSSMRSGDWTRHPRHMGCGAPGRRVASAGSLVFDPSKLV